MAFSHHQCSLDRGCDGKPAIIRPLLDTEYDKTKSSGLRDNTTKIWKDHLKYGISMYNVFSSITITNYFVLVDVLLTRQPGSIDYVSYRPTNFWKDPLNFLYGVQMRLVLLPSIPFSNTDFLAKLVAKFNKTSRKNLIEFDKECFKTGNYPKAKPNPLYVIDVSDGTFDLKVAIFAD